MSGPSSGEHNLSPEQLEIAQLSTAAQAALDFRNPSRKELGNGSSSRSFHDGNRAAICDLTEVTNPAGPKEYKFGFPSVLTAGNAPVMLEAVWSEGGSEVQQAIVAGDHDGRAQATFETLPVPAITAILNLHVGDPSKIAHQKRASRLTGKLGRLFKLIGNDVATPHE
jgi:hypothetical protein